MGEKQVYSQMPKKLNAETQKTKTKMTWGLLGKNTTIIQYYKVKTKRLMKCLKMNEENDHRIIRRHTEIN